MPLVLREEKGSQLTFSELDGNFTYLEGLDQGKLTTSSFNTFTSSYTTGSFTGSFVGDGSGLTNIPGVTPIATGSFATTGSNQFNGGQSISGSVTISGSISQVGVGTNNTFIGSEAGIARTTGINNTLIGSRAGRAINAGGFNTFIGRSAGTITTNGMANTAIGTDALFSNQGGSCNTVIGNNALSTATNSSYNIAIGESAAIVTSGSQIVGNPLNSIFIGALTKPQGTSDQNTIVIGYSAVGNGDNTVTIGDNNITATYLRGAVTITGSIQLTGSANITGGVTGSSFTGSFVGNGSGLTNIPGISPVLVYRASIQDDGTFVTPTVLENTTGRTITWGWNGDGYQATISGASIPLTKLMIRGEQAFNGTYGELFVVSEYRSSNNPIINIKAWTGTTFEAARISAGGTRSMLVEILIYP